MDRQAMTQSLDELAGYELSDLMDVSLVVSRLGLTYLDQECEHATALRVLQYVPVLLTFKGNAEDRAWHVEQALNELRKRDRGVLELLSTSLTQHAAMLVRVSSRQSSGLLLLARVLYVLSL